MILLDQMTSSKMDEETFRNLVAFLSPNYPISKSIQQQKRSMPAYMHYSWVIVSNHRIEMLDAFTEIFTCIIKTLFTYWFLFDNFGLNGKKFNEKNI